MIGGIGVGYSAGYAWQTAFNTFGALSIASGLFGMPYAVALRIGANVFGAAYDDGTAIRFCRDWQQCLSREERRLANNLSCLK